MITTFIYLEFTTPCSILFSIYYSVHKNMQEKLVSSFVFLSPFSFSNYENRRELTDFPLVGSSLTSSS